VIIDKSQKRVISDGWGRGRNSKSQDGEEMMEPPRAMQGRPMSGDEDMGCGGMDVLMR